MKNLIYLEGRLTHDPEMKTAKNGSQYAIFSLAHSQSTSPDHPSTSFYDCVAWRESADSVAKFNKGAFVEVTGSLQTRSWVTKDGQKRKSVEIRVNGIKPASAQPAATAAAPKNAASKSSAKPKTEITDEDGTPVKLPWDVEDE